MTAFDIIGLLVLGGLAWFWFDSSGAREAGVKAARLACQSEGLQLLDDTVAIASLRLVRNSEGRLVVRRFYKFEYSNTGNNRRPGSVELQGGRVIVVNIGLRLVPADTTLH